MKKRIAKDERSLILTLTKKMAEDLTDYLTGLGLKVKYIHSEVETIERVEILKGLRTGEFDVLIGINLLREGIDLPEVSFIGILDADKIGFLRSAGFRILKLLTSGSVSARAASFFDFRFAYQNIFDGFFYGFRRNAVLVVVGLLN